MIEIPIVVDDEDLVLAGYTDTVNLQVDVGPAGPRGSLIFSGSGDPPNTPPGADPIFSGVNEFQTNDFYINVSGANYGWLYQYVSPPGGSEWQKIVNMNPPLYVGTHTVVFTDGVSGDVTIPLSNIIGASPDTPAADKYVIQCTSNDSTQLYVVGVKSITVTEPNLVLTFHARELTTSVIETDDTVDVFITIGVKP